MECRSSGRRSAGLSLSQHQGLLSCFMLLSREVDAMTRAAVPAALALAWRVLCRRSGERERESESESVAAANGQLLLAK